MATKKRSNEGEILGDGFVAIPPEAETIALRGALEHLTTAVRTLANSTRGGLGLRVSVALRCAEKALADYPARNP